MGGQPFGGAGEIPSVDMDSLLQCPAELYPKEGVNINNCFLLKQSSSSPLPPPFLYQLLVQGTILKIVLHVANRVSRGPLEPVASENAGYVLCPCVGI